MKAKTVLMFAALMAFPAAASILLTIAVLVSPLTAAPSSDQTESPEQARKLATQTKTITGCLQKGYEPDEFLITGKDGKVWGLRSSAVKLDGHLGHKVTVSGLLTHESNAGEKKTGPGKESGDLRVTSLKMVSKTCSK